MPELPEVETVVRDLRPLLKKQRIASVDVRLQKIVAMPVRLFVKSLVGRAITNVRRRAKIIMIELDNQTTLLVHLKMSGQLVFVSSRGTKQYGGHPIVGGIDALPNKYSHVILRFQNGGHLYFNDQRQFGYMLVLPEHELASFFQKKKLGLEPFDKKFTLPYFLAYAKRHIRALIKSVLLDQSNVVGLGNIYVDEVLFAAGIRPSRRVASLSLNKIESIYLAIPKILGQAIKQRGTTFRSYRGGTGQPGGMQKLLKVYGREGERCRKCRRGVITRIKQGSRSSHYCPVCQK
ncbi:MAG: bifunctional DNA-formamidopyrimidine glycosylase/DNA-(apurinic or apyrimidinic site) lyase [Patescibacteria group bacterium]|jgi:formamidopyrimidine-DNA glycosylase